MSPHDTPLLMRRRPMMIGLATIALTLGPLETATSQVAARDAGVDAKDSAGVPTGCTPPVSSRLQAKAQGHGCRV